MNKLRSLFRKSFLWVLLAPYAFNGLGAASNQLVLIANHDKFPVMVNAVKAGHKQMTLADLLAGKAPQQAEPLPDGMIDDVHCIMTPQTHLNFLADIFDMHDAIYSIGDFSLMFSEYLATFTPYVWLGLMLKKLWDEQA